MKPFIIVAIIVLGIAVSNLFIQGPSITQGVVEDSVKTGLAAPKHTTDRPL